MKQLLYLLTFILVSCAEQSFHLNIERLELPALSGTCESIHFDQNNTAYIVGGEPWSSGFLYHSVDGGENWQIDTTTDKKITDIHNSPDSTILMVGVDGRIFYKKKSTTTWSFFRSDIWEIHKACTLKSDGSALIVGGNAYNIGHSILFSNNHSEEIVLEHAFELADVTCINDGSCFAVGYGVILRSDDGGSNWKHLDYPGDFYTAIQFVDQLNGFVIGSKGTLLETKNGGMTWERIQDQRTFANATIHSMYFLDNIHGYLVGAEGLLMRTLNGGKDWANIDHNIPFDIKDIKHHNGYLWFVGSDNSLHRFVPE